MDPASIRALKSLTDPSRLRVVGLLAARPMTPQALAEALGLSKATVAHHLARLREASLVIEDVRDRGAAVSLRLDRLTELARALDALGRAGALPAAPPDASGLELTPEDARTLRGFFEGDRLIAIPAQESKRLITLRYLRDRCFPDERAYPEREVNALLALHHPDVAALRRYMVDAGLMTRSKGEYRRA